MFPAEIFQQTVTKIVAILTQHGIQFHLTGGLTGAAYGEPRMTQDVDLVLNPVQTAGELEDILVSLAHSDFLYDEPSIRNAVASGGMFQLLDKIETLKLELYPRELIAGELGRSVLLEVFQGMELPVVCRVDAAASKLVWIDKGSHKSRRDLSRHLSQRGPSRTKANCRHCQCDDPRPIAHGCARRA